MCAYYLEYPFLWWTFCTQILNGNIWMATKRFRDSWINCKQMYVMALFIYDPVDRWQFTHFKWIILFKHLHPAQHLWVRRITQNEYGGQAFSFLFSFIYFFFLMTVLQFRHLYFDLACDIFICGMWVFCFSFYFYFFLCSCNFLRCKFTFDTFVSMLKTFE